MGRRLFWLIFTIFAVFVQLSVASILLASGQLNLLIAGMVSGLILISTYVMSRRIT